MTKERREERRRADPRERREKRLGCGPYMRSMFGLKVSLLFYCMIALFLCFYYMFNKYEKANFYFPYHFISFHLVTISPLKK